MFSQIVFFANLKKSQLQSAMLRAGFRPPNPKNSVGAFKSSQPVLGQSSCRQSLSSSPAPGQGEVSKPRRATLDEAHRLLLVSLPSPQLLEHEPHSPH